MRNIVNKEKQFCNIYDTICSSLLTPLQLLCGPSCGSREVGGSKSCGTKEEAHVVVVGVLDMGTMAMDGMVSQHNYKHP